MRSSYVASVDGRVHGWAYTTFLGTLVVSAEDKKRPTYVMNQLYVAPQHRGKGVAKSLLTRVTNDADSEGVILLLEFKPDEFDSDADRLKKLYEEFGFKWAEHIGGMKRVPNE